MIYHTIHDVAYYLEKYHLKSKAKILNNGNGLVNKKCLSWNCLQRTHKNTNESKSKHYRFHQDDWI